MEQLHKISFPVQELQVIYKQKFKVSDRPKISNSKDCYNVLLSTWNTEIMGFIEEFKILLLNRANRVIGCYEVSSGGTCGTVVDPKVVFAVALKCCAISIVLAHNHPSGNIKPSQADILITEKLKSAGQMLEINVLDHIILSPEINPDIPYYSFADDGMMM